jgi:hypothetical protein
MFDVEMSEARRVVLIRFHGELAEDDFAALDALGGERPATGSGYDVIFDMTAVEQVHLATDFVSRRGSLPQAFPDRERIYVVEQADLKLLVRLYAAYQASQGWRPPVLVSSLSEALERLGVTREDFAPPARRP